MYVVLHSLFIDDGSLSDDDFLVLYDYYASRNDYPYWKYDWKYGQFDLDSMDDAESWSLFRFFKNDIYRFKAALRIPDTILTYNRMKVDGVKALCVFLKRIAYPCRYVDMIPYFGRAVSDYSISVSYMLDHIYREFGHLLEEFNQPLLIHVQIWMSMPWQYIEKGPL